MTITQLHSLTEDELIMLLYILNVIKPIPLVPEVTPKMIPLIKHPALVQRVVDSFQAVDTNFYHIYSSLLTKLGIDHKIEFKQPDTPLSSSK